jgi:hypothetical protein
MQYLYCPAVFIANCESGHFVSPGDVEMGYRADYFVNRRAKFPPPAEITAERPA